MNDSSASVVSHDVFVGIDVARDKLDAFVDTPVRLFTVPNTLGGIRQVIEHLAGFGGGWW